MPAPTFWCCEQDSSPECNAFYCGYRVFAAYYWSYYSVTIIFINFHKLTILITVLLDFQSSGNSFLSNIQSPIMSVFLALNLLFVLFNYGQKLHSHLMNCSAMVYQTEWYRHPRSIKFFVLIMMMRTQKPFFLSAYGTMECNLGNFLGVNERENGRYIPKWISAILNLFSGVEINLLCIHAIAEY